MGLAVLDSEVKAAMDLSTRRTHSHKAQSARVLRSEALCEAGWPAVPAVWSKDKTLRVSVLHAPSVIKVPSQAVPGAMLCQVCQHFL